MDTTTDTPWLTEGQQRIWRSFLGGITVLQDQLDRDLRTEHGLSSAEYEILVRLSEAPEHSVRMAELADAISHSRSRVTHTVARLERAGIVVRGQAAEDGRGVSAILTDYGFSVLEKAAHTHVQGVHDYLLTNASDDEFAAIGRVMDRVLETLHGKPA